MRRNDRQDDWLRDLERRVQSLEGEVPVRQDHQAILHKLSVLLDEQRRLAAGLATIRQELADQAALIQEVLAWVEPVGSVSINVGPVTEIPNERKVQWPSS